MRNFFQFIFLGCRLSVLSSPFSVPLGSLFFCLFLLLFHFFFCFELVSDRLGLLLSMLPIADIELFLLVDFFGIFSVSCLKSYPLLNALSIQNLSKSCIFENMYVPYAVCNVQWRCWDENWKLTIIITN